MNFAMKPLSFRKQHPQYTEQQVTETGCCFPLFTSNYVNINQHINMNAKSYSQSKIKKEKKIDLLIAKKGSSQPKLKHIIQEQRSSNSLNNKNQLKNIQNTINLTSHTSKITTQRNSLKNSRAKLTLDNRVKNLGNQLQAEKFVTIDHKCYNFNNEKYPPQQKTKAQLTNIQYISEISIIEQQFVSHDSTALNALNFLNHYPFSQSKGHETVTPVRYMIDAINEKRNDQFNQTTNPLQKLSKRKKILSSNNNPRQKLYL